MQSGIGAINEREAAGRRARLRALRPTPRVTDQAAPAVEPSHDAAFACKARLAPGRRWNVRLTNGRETVRTDSQRSRLARCRKRVRAWAATLPLLNRRVREALARKAQQTGKEIGPRLVMVTLTYGDEETRYKKSDGWEPNHIREFMKQLRKKLGKKLWGYAWVMEMQRRDSPHYHLMLYAAPGTHIDFPDKSEAWPHGSTKIETAREGAFYLVKYTGKAYQKEGLPAGARMFAVQIYKDAATEEELFGFRLSAAPPWLQEYIKEAFAKIGARVRWARVRGGGWVIKQTGEILHSVWWVFSITPIGEDGPNWRELRAELEGRDGADDDARHRLGYI